MMSAENQKYILGAKKKVLAYLPYGGRSKRKQVGSRESEKREIQGYIIYLAQENPEPDALRGR